MIRASQLTKVYGSRPVLADVSFSIAAGTCVALRGSRGSGRSTLLRLLATQLLPTRGSLFIDETNAFDDVASVRKRVALVNGTCEGAARLTVGEYLSLVACTRATASAETGETVQRMLTQGGVEPGARVDCLDAGGRAAVALAAGLVANPDVLLIDGALDTVPGRMREPLASCVDAVRQRGGVIVFSDDLAALPLRCGRTMVLANERLADAE